MNRKGLFLSWVFWVLFPGRQETKLPCLRPPALLGVLLCICFPVANLTARHYRDHHAAHPQQLLDISESRARIPPAALRSSQHPAPNYKCSWQQDEIGNSPLLGCQREQRPAASGRQALPQPQHTRETTPARAQGSRERSEGTRQRRCLDEACTSDDTGKSTNQPSDVNSPWGS